MRDILAGNISRYRKDMGLTQEALAERLGITFQAVSKWETERLRCKRIRYFGGRTG